MTAWGTPALRDSLTVALLERDGWRCPRDVLDSCVWCGLSFWRRCTMGGNTGQRYCSKECAQRKRYWFALGRGWYRLTRLRRANAARRRYAERRIA